MDAHTHGLASLDVAVEGSDIQLYFVSPADGIYGFEHDPINSSQREIVDNALEVMQTPDWLLGELVNQCEVTESALNAGVSLTESHALDKHEEHDHAAHDDHASHQEHAPHDELEALGQHSEVEAHYSLSCEQTLPSSIAITAFAVFPAIEEIQVQWISESAQGGAELTANNATLNFER
jgi:hypothetical protein